jgi:hypothetical protein
LAGSSAQVAALKDAKNELAPLFSPALPFTAVARTMAARKDIVYFSVFIILGEFIATQITVELLADNDFPVNKNGMNRAASKKQIPVS